MKKPKSVKALEELGRVRLSKNFFLRDFLYSEVAQIFRIPNIPDEPDLAIEVGKMLCNELLEPLQEQFGRVAIRSGYRSSELNALCNQKKLNCARNEKNYAAHIWDRKDANGQKGATACIVIPAFSDFLVEGGDWREMAWYIHDNLPYSSLYFFPKLGAFNLRWSENPDRRIDSYLPPKGTLTKPGMANNHCNHADKYENLLKLVGPTQSH
jgi:hypothetical protein